MNERIQENRWEDKEKNLITKDGQCQREKEKELQFPFAFCFPVATAISVALPFIFIGLISHQQTQDLYRLGLNGQMPAWIILGRRGLLLLYC